MITDFFLNLFGAVISWFISILPVFQGFPTGVQSAMNWVHNSLQGMNSIFPMDTLYQVALLIFGVEAAWFSFKLLHFLYNKIRGAG